MRERNRLARVIDKYSDMVYRIAFQAVGTKADAEDITQDVFLRLLEDDTERSEEHLKAWLIRVTVNRTKDFFRSRWNQRMELSEEQIKVEHREAFSELNELEGEERTLIYLFYYEGYKQREIAEILGLNPSTVGTKIQRAKEKLKGILFEAKEAIE
ncbi:RNA polymerase sigma factor [Guggenheimella bovis]